MKLAELHLLPGASVGFSSSQLKAADYPSMRVDFENGVAWVDDRSFVPLHMVARGVLAEAAFTLPDSAAAKLQAIWPSTAEQFTGAKSAKSPNSMVANQCDWCGKYCSSGRALGGHKRHCPKRPAPGG